MLRPIWTARSPRIVPSKEDTIPKHTRSFRHFRTDCSRALEPQQFQLPGGPGML